MPHYIIIEVPVFFPVWCPWFQPFEKAVPEPQVSVQERMVPESREVTQEVMKQDPVPQAAAVKQTVETPQVQMMETEPVIQVTVQEMPRQEPRVMPPEVVKQVQVPQVMPQEVGKQVHVPQVQTGEKVVQVRQLQQVDKVGPEPQAADYEDVDNGLHPWHFLGLRELARLRCASCFHCSLVYDWANGGQGFPSRDKLQAIIDDVDREGIGEVTEEEFLRIMKKMRQASEDLNNDRDDVVAAVTQHSDALQYVSEEIKTTMMSWLPQSPSTALRCSMPPRT